MIRVRQVRVELLNHSFSDIKRAVSKKLKIKESDILSLAIKRESIDARRKEDIFYSYEVDIEVEKEESILKKNLRDVLKAEEESYIFVKSGTKEMKHRPIIVGSGPAGLFAAYLLAEQGYHPLILERGEKIEDRVNTVNKFWETNKLNPNSNVQFGEGGAGTFSDGKLNTMVKEKGARCKKVFEIFVENGAPSEIFYLQKPHIGTDLLRKVVVNIRNKIIEMGGEIRYHSQVTHLEIENNQLVGVEVNKKEKIPCDVLVLAIGHSARDTFQMLYEKGFEMRPKPFAIGVRVSHKQEMINTSQYASFKNLLPPASYKLTYTTKKGRGVYSFCMCPGGYVVNASSEEGGLVVNGMSNYERESENANSAIVVTIKEEDYGHHPLDGIVYQRKLEQFMYKIGNGKIPVQRLEDFMNNQTTTKIGCVKPIVKGNFVFANLRNALPDYITESFIETFPNFDQKIKGFGDKDTLLMGLESRTSSPVRILRDENLESSIKGVFPCGEGSGYAGGITTSAMDGIRVSEKIISTWAKYEKN